MALRGDHMSPGICSIYKYRNGLDLTIGIMNYNIAIIMLDFGRSEHDLTAGLFDTDVFINISLFVTDEIRSHFQRLISQSFQMQGLYSLSGKTSYRQISWSLEAGRLGVIMIVSRWNLTCISAALLPRCLLNFRAIAKVQTRISRLRGFTRPCGKTAYRLVNRGPGDMPTVSSECS